MCLHADIPEYVITASILICELRARACPNRGLKAKPYVDVYEVDSKAFLLQHRTFAEKPMKRSPQPIVARLHNPD